MLEGTLLPGSPTTPETDGLALSAWEVADAHLTHLLPNLVEYRRHLHRYPELSLQEIETSAFIARTLEAEKIPYRFGSGMRGVLVDLGPSGVPRIALRADCDALPIQEENTFAHASCHPGIMHACGHDAHTAMLLGVVIALARAGAPVATRAIFQPAEEGGDGALGMIADGALDEVSAIIALHVDPNLTTGQAAVVAGMQSASCQDFQIRIKGSGGHAARPHLTIDPVAIGAGLLTQIYQAVPRQVDARQSVVVSVCQFHAGHANNVIPDNAELGGTVRSLDNASAEIACRVVETLCRGVAAASGATVEADFQRRIPGVANDADICAVCAAAAQDMMGVANVVTSSPPSLGAEDFSDYLQQVPGCMMRLGVRNPEREITPLHTPTFDIDERALSGGARLLLRSLFKLARRHVD